MTANDKLHNYFAFYLKYKLKTCNLNNNTIISNDGIRFNELARMNTNSSAYTISVPGFTDNVFLTIYVLRRNNLTLPWGMCDIYDPFLLKISTRESRTKYT